MKTTLPALLPTLLLSVLTLTAVSPALPAEPEDVSRVNGSIQIEDGKQVGSVETVNGSIEIGASVTAGDVETVNGSILIGRDSQVGDIDSVNGRISLDPGAKAASIETVNGKLNVGEQASVQGGISAVNGSISLAKAAQVGGELENVNGTIKVDGAQVNGSLKTTSGDIEIGAGSRIDGGILVEKPNFSLFSRKRTPKIVIGPGAVVNGTLRFEREVELRISNTAKVGKIIGAEPIRE